jgi:multicomponent Na+:H+ antiporter subunit E
MSPPGRPKGESFEQQREAGPVTAHGPKVGVALVRALLYFGIWIVVDQSAKPANLAFGVFATVAATWVSLRLMPPEAGRVRLGALAMMLPRFLWQSVAAGIDVARRAFAPRLSLAPGFVDYPASLPRGSARNAFSLISSLLPGTVPTGESDAHIEYHCLDDTQPVVEQLAAQERAYSPALVPGRRHG